MYKNQKGTSLSKFNEMPINYKFGIDFAFDYIYNFENSNWKEAKNERAEQQ